MRKKIIAALGIAGVGIIAVVLMISSISPVFVQNLLAKEQNIGAANPPVVLSDQVKALNDAYTAVSKAVIPTVVSIKVLIESEAKPNPFQEQFKDFFQFYGNPFDQGPQEEEAGGSGVFISDDGYILTNNHVVEDAKEIKVTTLDNKEYDAKLIGRDPLTDIAVIKIDGKGFPAAHFGNTKDIKIGDLVIAVGNPLGLNSTVTSGIVSAIGRGNLSLSSKQSRYAVENFIQTDAAINPGNSGGGLFNLEGSLIGINSAIATRTGTYIGYGFAIPVDLAKAVAMDLIEDGKIDRGYIGVSIETVDEVMAKYAGLKDITGVLVQGVLKGSPAEKAGLKLGDIILQVDGQNVKTSNELQNLVALKKAGDEVNLVIWRDGKKIDKTVVLKPREGENVAENAVKGGEENSEQPTVDKSYKFDTLGFKVEALTKEEMDKFDVKNGVFISEVERYSPAAERRLFPGGVIVKVDRQEVTSVSQFKKILESKKKGSAVLLQVKYQDSMRLVALEMPA